MASEIRPLGHSGHTPAWSADSDHPGNYDSHRDYSRDTFENGADETGSTAATNGWHHNDVRYTATIDPAPSWSTNRYNNSSRVYNHNEQPYQHQQPPPPPPPPSLSLQTVQHIPSNRHTHFQHTQNPAPPHIRFETSRVQFDQPVSPTPSYSTEDIHGGQRNHDNYDNAYSTTTTPNSRAYLWFDGDYKGDDDYISEDANAPRSEAYFSLSITPTRERTTAQPQNTYV
ncbi:MAG: hypothetical protein J3R72DRAFT_490627 [Linnemannia gamsii]|nr:MAG: hypothetical protein J3R72DRAFT_490627 [Linnemannia gamsii]